VCCCCWWRCWMREGLWKKELGLCKKIGFVLLKKKMKRIRRRKVRWREEEGLVFFLIFLNGNKYKYKSGNLNEINLCGNFKKIKIKKIIQHARLSVLSNHHQFCPVRCWLLGVGVNQKIFILQVRIYNFYFYRGELNAYQMAGGKSHLTRYNKSKYWFNPMGSHLHPPKRVFFITIV